MIVDKKDIDKLKIHMDKVTEIYEKNIGELDADTIEDAFKEGINVAIQALALATVSQGEADTVCDCIYEHIHTTLYRCPNCGREVTIGVQTGG